MMCLCCACRSGSGPPCPGPLGIGVHLRNSWTPWDPYSAPTQRDVGAKNGSQGPQLFHCAPKGRNYQGSGSKNPARPGFGTRPDAGPGSFSTIKFGKSPCPSARNSCAARVPNPVQTVAGQSPVRPYQHFCTIRPGPLQGIGGDVPTRRTQILLLSLRRQQ